MLAPLSICFHTMYRWKRRCTSSYLLGRSRCIMLKAPVPQVALCFACSVNFSGALCVLSYMHSCLQDRVQTLCVTLVGQAGVPQNKESWFLLWTLYFSVENFEPQMWKDTETRDPKSQIQLLNVGIGILNHRSLLGSPMANKDGNRKWLRAIFMEPFCSLTEH